MSYDGDLTRLAPSALGRLSCDLRHKAFVVLEGFARGWRAEVGGAAPPVLKANLLLRAVPGPAGTHRVEMRYRPPSARRGALVTSFGMVVAGLMFVWRGRLGR